MHSAKTSSGSKFYHTQSAPHSVKADSLKATSAELSTEGQQERIKKLIQDFRKGGPNSPNAIIISQSDLSRMKKSASIRTKEELLQQKKLLLEQNEKQHAAAKAKKQKMLEIEADRKKNLPPSEAEMEATMKNETLQSRAQQLLNEEMDDVKQMNQMMLYAKVVTIRDNQLVEKNDIRGNLKMEEKRKDLMMEIDRLQKIKYYEEVERKNREEQRKAALEIVDQVKQRELERLKEQEEREREGQEMLKHIKQLEREEREQTLVKKNQQKGLLDQIYNANQKAISKKHERIQAEKEEDDRILQYNIEKAQKEAEYLAEQKRIKDEKEREVQRLRELQEKAFDRQAEIDALRAKRATELADRQAREKDRKEAEVRAKINDELMEARHLQSLEKDRRLQEQAVQERDEFQRIVQAQKLDRDAEVRTETDKATRLKQHSEQLKSQISANEEKKKQERKEFLEEGKKVRDKLKNEKHLLEGIKSQKLEELTVMGIESKYTAELQKKRIAI